VLGFCFGKEYARNPYHYPKTQNNPKIVRWMLPPSVALLATGHDLWRNIWMSNKQDFLATYLADKAAGITFKTN